MKSGKMGKLIIVLSFLLFSIISFSQTADESWVRIGVAFSGDITALAVSPYYETDTTIFIGVSGAGLWVSNDRGDSWTQCTAVPCDATVTGIALPQDFNFGEGDPCFAVTNEGYFYRSVDDFAGFTDIFSVTNPLTAQLYPMTSIVLGGISVFNNKVYIGLWGKGVYAHYSGGVGSAGWNYLGPDQINYCRSLTLSSEASQTLWASFNRDGGNAILRYSGSGVTWYSPNVYCPSDDVLVVRSSWVAPQYLWAGTSNLGMWRSTDGGNTWAAACDGQTVPNYVDYEVRAIRETPNSGTDLEMWEGRSDGLRKSTNVGASCLDANPRAKINCIEFSPRYKMTGAVYCDAFVGTERGLYRIECGNFPASRTPVVVDGKTVAIAHDGKGYFMGSLTGGFFKSLTGRRNMVQYNNFPNGKIPQITAICLYPAYNDEDDDCEDENTLFVAANFPDSPSDNGVYVSGDGGNSWIKLTGGQWPSQPVEVRDLAISPNVSTDYGVFAATSLYLYRWNGFTGGWSRCGEGVDPADIYWVALTPTYNGNANCSYIDGGTTYYGYPCNMVWIGAKNGNSNVRLFYNLSNGNGPFTELYPPTFCSNYPAACPVDVTGITFPGDFGVQDGNINHKIFVSSSTKGILRNTEFLWPAPWVPFNDGLPRSNNSTPYTYNVVDITSDPDWINGDGVSENAILLCAVPSAYTMSQSGIYRAFNASGTPTWSQIIQGQGLSVAYETKTGNDNTEAMAGLGTNLTINPDNYGAFYMNRLHSNPPSTIEHFTGYYSLPDDVSSSVAHERNSNYVFAASPSMGVFVSTNKGLSFRPFNEGAGGTDGPCRLTNGYSITMLKDRRETNIDALYVGTLDGIKARYILFSPDLNKIYLDLADGSGTPSSWLNSNWYSGGRTTGFWNRLEVIPLSGLTYPIWASSPGHGFANLDSDLYDGWRLQTTGLPSNPNVRDVRTGYDGANATTTRLLSGQMVSDVVKQNYWDYYYIITSYYNNNLQVILDDHDDIQSGGGNPNLYIKYGSAPTDSSYDYFFGTDGDESTCIAAITNENFDGAWSPTSPPSGWTITTNESPVTWNEDNWYRYYKSTPPRTYYPLVTGSSSRTSQDEWMISPLFNLPSTLSSASVTFNHRLILGTPGAVAYVKFKSTQNPTWITLLTRSTTMVVEVTPTIDLSSYIGNTNCQIAFQYYDPSPATGRSWYFDNFEVYGYYNASAPQCLSLRPGSWYIGVKGGANNNNPYTLKVFLDNGCSQYPTFVQTGESGLFIPPDPKAPIGGTTWGTVTGTGVIRGSGTTTVMFTQTSAQPENLNLQTIIQLPDTTLIVGCDASSSSDKGIFYSPAGDEGETIWNEASSVANEGSKKYVDIIQASNGDVLIAANGTGATPGGVWLSGDKGKNWMNISQGFDSESQELLDIVADNGTPPSYYSSTDTTGLWTRTITASPYPTVTGINPASGPSTGGTSITITGTGFLNTCPTENDYDCPTLNPVVIFGDTETEGTYLSATSISAITPPQSAGEVVVKIRNPDTRESSVGVGFTYTFSCSPPSGFSNNTATDLNGCADEGVKIDWSAPSNWGDGGSGTRTYDILRNGSVIQTGLSFSTVTYTDTTGVNGTTYSYQVRANNGCGQSTTTTGVSAADTVNPGAPTITAVNDVDSCAQNGVQIVYTAGSGATSHNLYRDGSLAVTGYSSGSTYNPGDTSSHNYVIRAIKGTCYTNSNTMAGTDANNTPSAPSITGIVDNDPLNLTGITITYTAGSPATKHDLYKDTALVQENFVSGTVYYPLDSDSHSYFIRSVNGSCFADSSPVSGQDQTASTPPPEIATGSSYPDDAQWWTGGVQHWPSSAQANGYKLYRLEKADLPNLQNSTNEGCYRDTGATNSYDCSLDDPSSLTYKVYFYLVTGYNGAGEGSAGDGRQLSSTTICSP